MKDTKLYLVHIQESIVRIESYAKDGEDVFMASQMAQDAVIRNLEVIGEAVKQIPDDFRAMYPAVPWRRMAGLRDVLIHDYMGVNIEEVWVIVQDHIPALKKSLEGLLSRGQGLT